MHRLPVRQTGKIMFPAVERGTLPFFFEICGCTPEFGMQGDKKTPADRPVFFFVQKNSVLS